MSGPPSPGFMRRTVGANAARIHAIEAPYRLRARTPG
jgi:hypothetical protein